MSRYKRRPDLPYDLSRDRKRTERIERQVDVPPPAKLFGERFSYPGTLGIEVSPRWYPEQGGRLVSAYLALTTGTATVTLRLNGNVYETVSLTTTGLTIVGTDQPFGVGDYVETALTAASGADLAIKIWAAP